MLNSGLLTACSRQLHNCCFFIFILLITLNPSIVLSQTSTADVPVPGDIIFTQIGSSEKDRVEFITLKRLNLTSIKLTDNPVLSDGTLGSNEGAIEFSEDKFAVLADVPGGTFVRCEYGSGTDETDMSDRVVTFYYHGGLTLSMDGDQVIAYTGSSSSPTFIAGANYGNKGWLTSGSTTSNTSYAPNTISDIHLGPLSNYRFNKSIDAEADSTRNYIKDVSNWEGSDSPLEFTLKNIGDHLLPVELISFSGNYSEKRVMLKWKTATEVNNFGWDIEKKYDGIDWQKAGFIGGHGNTNSPKEYFFCDNNVQFGKVFFYRLKQIDNNGETIQYSEIIKIEIPEINKFHVAQNYPNPFNSSTIISYTIAEECMVSLTLFNTLGEEIASFIKAKQQPGNYDFRLDLSAINNHRTLMSGIYLYKLQAGGLNMVRKFILLK